METPNQSCLVARDHVRNGLIVTVRDCAPSFYSASALHAGIPSQDDDVPSEKDLQISSVDRLKDGGVIVEFSDGSIATFTVAELLQLRPDRILPNNDQLR